MPSGSAGRRYAQAVFDLALSSNQLDQWESDLEVIRQVFQTREVANVLENPKSNRDKKVNLINQILQGRVSQPALNLALLLVNRSRQGYIGQIVDIYKHELYQMRGIGVAEVTTAVPISEAEENLIRQKLTQLTGYKQIVINKRVDPSIIGGMVARIGDTLIDGSVTSRLQTLRKNLAS